MIQLGFYYYKGVSMSDYSLSIYAMRSINEHQNEMYVNIVSEIVITSIIDRVLGASLSILAALDIGYHLSVSAYKTVKEIALALQQERPFSFKEAKQHLKIIKLFYSTVLFGSLACFINPSFSNKFFLSHKKMGIARNLLLSGNPEAFASKDTGMMESIGIRDIQYIIDLIENLPKEKQVLIENTLQRLNTIQKLLPHPKIINLALNCHVHSGQVDIESSHKILMDKIKCLKEGERVLLPMNSSTTQGAHAFNITIAKLKENYRVSVVNRGAASKYYHSIKEKSYQDVDFTWDNIPYEFLDIYLKLIVLNKNLDVIKNRRKLITGLSNINLGPLTDNLKKPEEFIRQKAEENFKDYYAGLSEEL